MSDVHTGPLRGYRIIELSGLGPGPMGGMMLADMGAEVIRVERAGSWNPLGSNDISFRGKKSIVLNLKDPDAVEVLLRLVETADALIDERVTKLQRHFDQAGEDVRQIRISTEKIAKRGERIEEMEFEAPESAEAALESPADPQAAAQPALERD